MEPSDAVRISAVIPAYNAERFISDPIESILAQTYEIFEIIVVDDGSSDRTAEVASKYPKTRVVRRNNGGQAAARNTGIKRASGEWIAFLDHDDVWHPQKTEVQVKFIAPHVGVIHANRFESIHYGTLWHRQAHITPSGALVRKQTLLDVGGFEETRTVMGVEDLTLWLKIALTDWQFVRSSHALFEWRQTGQNQSNNEFRMAKADRANISIAGERVRCDPEEVKRVQEASRIEYAKNLIAVQRWDQAHELLKECSPGLAARWLSLASFLRMKSLARTDLVQWLHSVDAKYGSRVCSGECSLPEHIRRKCIESCSKPYHRPPLGE